MQPGPPDFVIMGAQRAGTTWWFHLLTSQEGVRKPAGKWSELHVFDRFVERWPTPADIEAYHGFFARRPGERSGEKTPDYLACPWVPAMLREAAPDARLIVLVRDPVTRYVSAMAMLRRRHQELGDRHDYLVRQALATDQFARGLYAQQLRWLFDAWPREQVLVLQYERCVIDTRGQLARTMRHVGLDPDAGMVIPPRFESTGGRTREADAERTALMVAHYRPDVEELTRLVPDLDLELWPNFRSR
jgi:hypothetical protein